MNHPVPPPPSAPENATLRRGLLAGLLTAVACLTVPQSLLADQVFKACGKKWVRKATKLESVQLAWMLESRSGEMTADLDGDALPDTVVLTSTPSFRNCDVTNLWDRKETTIRIEYGHGKKQIFHWISGQLVEKLVVYAALGRILVVGADAQGEPASRWVEYGKPRAPQGVAVAEVPDPQPPAAAGTFQIAGVR